MHSNNAYLMRAMKAERQLSYAVANGHKLALAYRDSLDRHRQALDVVEELATVALTRRHRVLAWLSARLGLKDNNPTALAAMLAAIRNARSEQPAPSPSADQAPSELEPQEPPEPTGAEKLRLIRGGGDVA